jgi:hypothetical protein
VRHDQTYEFSCQLCLRSIALPVGQADAHKLRLWVPSVLRTPARLTASVRQFTCSPKFLNGNVLYGSPLEALVWELYALYRRGIGLLGDPAWPAGYASGALGHSTLISLGNLRIRPIMQKVHEIGMSELPVLRQPAHRQTARPPIGARRRSGSDNTITELRHHSQGYRQAVGHTVLAGLFDSQNCVPAVSLTIWSSRRPQAPLVGALRASHCGAAYRER